MFEDSILNGYYNRLLDAARYSSSAEDMRATVMRVCQEMHHDPHILRNANEFSGLVHAQYEGRLNDESKRVLAALQQLYDTLTEIEHDQEEQLRQHQAQIEREEAEVALKSNPLFGLF